jgi:hypothetical protein
MRGEISIRNAHGRTRYKYFVPGTAVCVSDRVTYQALWEALCQSKYEVPSTHYWEWPLFVQHRIVPRRRRRLDLLEQISLDSFDVERLEHVMQLRVVAHPVAHPRI